MFYLVMARDDLTVLHNLIDFGPQVLHASWILQQEEHCVVQCDPSGIRASIHHDTHFPDNLSPFKVVWFYGLVLHERRDEVIKLFTILMALPASCRSVVHNAVPVLVEHPSFTIGRRHHIADSHERF